LAEGGHEIGKITKQWAGFVREYFTRADQFGVSCEFPVSFLAHFYFTVVIIMHFDSAEWLIDVIDLLVYEVYSLRSVDICGIRRQCYGGGTSGVGDTSLFISPAASDAAIVLDLVSIDYITVNLVN